MLLIASSISDLIENFVFEQLYVPAETVSHRKYDYELLWHARQTEIVGKREVYK